MNGPILRTKAELDQAAYFAERFAEITRTSTPDMLASIPKGLNKSNCGPLMSNVDMLVKTLGPRMILLLMSQSFNEILKMRADGPAEANRVLEGWSTVLGHLANDSTMAPIIFDQIMQAQAMHAVAGIEDANGKLPGEIKPANDKNES